MSIFYMDYVNGLDATTNTPLGWWSVAFTGGSVTAPVADEQGIGATSGSVAKLTVAPVITSGSFAGNNAAGTMYWYGKSDPFVAEQIDFTGGGHVDIAGDFTYCAWKTITLGATAARIAPGDTIRIAKSPDPTSIGQSAQWTTCTTKSGGTPASKSISATANNGSGAIRITTSAVHNFSNNDVVHVWNINGTTEAIGVWVITWVSTTQFDLIGSIYATAYSSLGQCHSINERALVINTPVTKTIAPCESAWTVGAQTTSANAVVNGKEGGYYVSIITAATCNANQIIARFGLASSIDLSGYQQISFWIYNAAALIAGDLQIRLYSDAICTNLVETFVIPAIPTTGYWIPITINKGSALSSTVKGIAVYTTVQFNTKTTYFDCFIACKASSTADSLTLQSLVSKNTLVKGTTTPTGYGDEPWWPIQSISGNGTYTDRIIILDGLSRNALLSSTTASYVGTTEVATIYKRETIKTALAATTTTNIQSATEGGVAGSLISYEGGYDPYSTNMVTAQNGETFFDGLACTGYGIYVQYQYTSYNLISMVRYDVGIQLFNGTRTTITLMTNVIGCNSYGVYVSGYNCTITIVNTILNGQGFCSATTGYDIIIIYHVFSNVTAGITLWAYNYGSTFTIYKISNCGSYNIYIGSSGFCDNRFLYIGETSYSAKGLYIYSGNNNNVFDILNNVNYNTDGIYNYGGCNNIIKSGTTIGNTADVNFGNNNGGTLYMNNFVFGDSTEATGFPLGESRLYSTNHDAQVDNHQIFTRAGRISSDATTNRHTPSGICWKLAVTDVVRDYAYPLFFVIARIACQANKQVTVKAWMKLTNVTDILGALVCKVNQLPWLDGASDIKTNMSTVDTNYHEVSISFTPTIAGVIEIEAWAWWVAGTADESVYIDDMTITQAS